MKLGELRFILGLSSMVANLTNPAELRIEALSHVFVSNSSSARLRPWVSRTSTSRLDGRMKELRISKDVTVARVALLRDAVLDLFDSELGDAFTTWAREGWGQLLSYIGGALVWVKAP